MAVKTITIDLEAYEALSRLKCKGDSFSRVIKKHFARRSTGRDLRSALQDLHIGNDTLETLDEILRSRRRSPAKAPRL
jgi:predicted CopG family antitoxin